MLELSARERLSRSPLAFVDGRKPAHLRHAPNTGSRMEELGARRRRPSRAVRLALIIRPARWACRRLLTPNAGASTTSSSAASRSCCASPHASSVMENVLFKISFPAEFRTQTAVEAALSRSAPELAAMSDHPRRHRRPSTIRTPARLHRDHRQIRKPAAISNRPRPLHPVRGRGAMINTRPPHRRQTTRTASRPIRASMPFPCQDDLRRGSSLHPATITIRKSARSPTRSRCGSPTAPRSPRWWWNIRSATSAAAPRWPPHLEVSSAPAWRGAFRQSNRVASSTAIAR